jgi:capsid protein
MGKRAKKRRQKQAERAERQAQAREGRMKANAQNARLRHITASVDAAQTTHENSKHWAAADALSANSAASQQVRKTLRQRSRYEEANNGYATGVTKTLANDIIGIGPRLQMETKDADRNARVEAEFAAWAKRVKLAKKLRVMRRAYDRDGEAFALLVSNPSLAGPVELDVKVVECDRFTNSNPTFDAAAEVEGAVTEVDGIFYDEFDNPISYRMLESHPGDTGDSWSTTYTDVPARYVIHYTPQDRPEQKRGWPTTTPSLQLYPNLRRWTLATIAAAEECANLALVLQTGDVPPIGDGDSGVQAMDVLELERRMATVLPSGYQLGQPKPEQPTPIYADFKREIVTEIGRPHNMPRNVMDCDSSGYNYASGRLDHQTYDRSNDVERDDLGADVLDPILAAWLQEFDAADRAENRDPVNAVYTPGASPAPEPVDIAALPHQWFWPEREHVDPVKVTSAQRTELETGATTYPAMYAKKGQDWQTQMAEQAKALGLSLPDYQALLRQKLFGAKTNDQASSPSGQTSAA